MINSNPFSQTVIRNLSFLAGLFLSLVIILAATCNNTNNKGKKVTFASKQKLDAVTIDGIRYLKLVTVNKDTLYNPINLEDNANSLAIINTIDSTMMGKTITWREVTLKRLPSGITTISK